MSAHHHTILRRKLVDSSAQRSLKQANGAFGQVISKIAKEFELSLGLIRRQSQRVKSTDLGTLFSPFSIFAHTLSVEDAPVFICLDPIMASALIEMQTISFVSGRACVDRKPSITDRALIAPFLDHLLHQCAPADILPKITDRPKFEENAQELEIQMESGVYRVIHGTFRLQGSDLKMQIALGVKEASIQKEASRTHADPHPQMFDVRTEFDAVLFRRSMSLSALDTLAVGDTITFPRTTLERVTLCPKGLNTGPTGHLGKSNGLFAVSFPNEAGQDDDQAIQTDRELIAAATQENADAENFDDYLSGLEQNIEAEDWSGNV